MHFAPTDDQVAFTEATRSMLARLCGSDAVRKAWATGRPPESLWRGLSDLGLLTIVAPEELGGGGSELELAAAMEEVGRVAAPGPIVETAAIAVPLLAAFAPDLLDGDRLAGGITVTETDLLPHSGAGTALLLESERIRLIEVGGVRTQESLDSSRAVVRLQPALLEEARTLAEGVQVGAAIARARDRAAMATAAVLVGLSMRAIAMTVEYTSARRQFGVPVGSFQAVKHHLADAHVAVEMARPTVEAAAWALAAHAEDAGRICSIAKVTANKAGRRAAKAALQCHGAIGYTMEADLHLYLMRIWSLLNAWGTTEQHLDRVAGTLPELSKRGA